MTQPATKYGQEIRSWALVSALMQVGWRLYLTTIYVPRGDGTSGVRELWVLVSPDMGKGAGATTRPVVMRTIERMRKAGCIVPSQDPSSDEWVRGEPPPRTK